MNLFEWLKQERGRQAALSRFLGIKQPQVADWISGDKPIPLAHMADIEAFTSGEVRRWDLRPLDWHRIWPELTQVEGAPPVEAITAQEAA